ncbi:hypothetical protein ACWEC4_18495, partial [Streptomyces sp. NPDC005055]
ERWDGWFEDFFALLAGLWCRVEHLWSPAGRAVGRGVGIRPFGRRQMRTPTWKLPMVFIDS